MKALLVSPVSQSIEAIEIDGLDDIKHLIGFDTIVSDAIGTGDDRIYFDEECFLRGSTGRFQIDSIIPISGKAVIAGATDDGVTLCDVVTDIDNLRGRIKYL